MTALELCGVRGNGNPRFPGTLRWPCLIQRRLDLLCFALAEVPRRFPLPIYLVQSDALSPHFNAVNSKVYSRKRLVLAGQQQAVGQQACPARQRTLGGHPRQLGKIVAFR